MAAVVLGVLTTVSLLAPPAAFADSGQEWTIYGGDYANTRYSSLKQINKKNVGKLSVAWMHSMGVIGSQENSPLIVGGTMYVASSMGPAHVFALDAKTGALKWEYEPELPNDYQATVCCGMGNRGLTHANGMIFVNRLDAKMDALSAASGDLIWSTEVMPYKKGFSMTSAPLIVKDKVVTGFSGGEFGVRGALQAYDQKTGQLKWRTFTIPGAGEAGNESWKGESWMTGGGTPWYVGAYDPDLNLIYYGTSNAAPWGGSVRGNDSSDIGQYSNLHTASQLAVDADTGKIVWHYQMTPSDVWDFDGVNEPVLATLKINGKSVPALMKADRNGFFYVLDRRDGTLLAADPFVYVNWAKHVDLKTGKPVENPEFRPRLDTWAKGICPNLIGGKNWPPMAYNRDTGLVYIPAFNMCMDLINREQKFVEGKFYLAQEFDLAKPGHSGDNLGEFMAWDPVQRKKVWSIKEDLPFVGGAMTTATGLVFYGNVVGEVKALDAGTGEVLWRFNTGSGISQSPVTYEVGGKQYLAVMSGRLQGPPSFFGAIGERVMAASPQGGNLVVFALS